jgi:peptidoglycan/LPS O-acetylase OafA/YrhL
VPYGNKFAGFPVFNYGWLGVYLFFLISGFVILMTLEKCSSFKEFILKRWLRLFPAMLIVTVLIFLSAGYFYERPGGIPNIWDTISGLIFTEPYFIEKIFNIKQFALEGTFWSLFVEVKYYFIFGILYYCFGRKKAIGGLLLLYIVAVFIKAVNYFIKADYLLRLDGRMNLLSFEFFGWFATGSLMYLFFTNKNNKYKIYAVITGIISAISLALTNENPIGIFVSAALILLVFISTVCFDSIKKVFENKVLLYFGFISYPLYLIHENAMISLILKINRQFEFVPMIILPVISVMLLVTVSHLIAKFIEPAIKRLLTKSIKLVKTSVNRAYASFIR